MRATLLPLPAKTQPQSSLRLGAPLAAADFAALRTAMVLEHCKWDPQVGDVSTLARFPLILSSAAWEHLQRDAEMLAAEMVQAQAELLLRPALVKRLGLPAPIRRAIASAGWTPAAVGAARRLPSVVRFDFHWTSDGWRISEANADVPGAFSESSALPALVAPLAGGGAEPCGDPAGRWVHSIAESAVGAGAAVALLSAPGHMEDHQVTAYLARRLRQRGVAAEVCGPANLRWDEQGRATLHRGGGTVRLDAVVRFFQAEWLAGLPRRTGWRMLFRPIITTHSATVACNPATSILTESKRFPLVWDRLSEELPTWRRLLPETREPAAVNWRRDERWLLKAAFCNTGDAVLCPADQTGNWRRPAKEAAWARRSARWRPDRWVAQRRFDAIPLDTPMGPMFACVGVYTINGVAAGAYGRLSPRPLIDYQAIDAAVLVDRELGVEGGG